MGEKSGSITLSPEERSYLEQRTPARTIQALSVCRARILLLCADGTAINAIAEKVGINRCSVIVCIKINQGGVENVLLMHLAANVTQKSQMMKKPGTSALPARSRLILTIPLKH